MKGLKALGLGLGVVAAALAGLYFAMAERVEVVVLHSRDGEGDHETRLWVVDDAGHAWLRTGGENGSWLPRIRAHPAVELERGDETLAFNAVLVTQPETVARVNQRTLEKYGWSEELLRASGMDPAQQVAVRLDPR